MVFGVKSMVCGGIKGIYKRVIFSLLRYNAPIAQYSSPVGDRFQVYHIRYDRNSGSIIIYDQYGTPYWNIEQLSPVSSIWRVYSVESRCLVAQIKLGALDLFVQFYRNPEIGMSRFYRELRCGGLFNCQFVLKDGSTYVWTKQTQCLEEIIRNSQGKEVRRRLARANRLRKSGLDWEVVVNTEFNPLIAVITAFIPMKTQWGHVAPKPSGVSLQLPLQLQLPTFSSQENGFSKRSGRLTIDPEFAMDSNDSTAITPPRFSFAQEHMIYQEPDTDLSFFNPTDMETAP